MTPEWVLHRHADAARLTADRARLLAALRAHLDGRGFLEASPPPLAPHAGQEPHLHPPQVALAGLPHPLWLQTSPELALKRLLCAGVGSLYSLGFAFRGGREEVSPHHQPQFTMLEWYRPGRSVADLIEDVDQLSGAACLALSAPQRVGRRVLSVEQALAELADASLQAVLADRDPASRLSRLMVERVEPALARLGGWTFLHSYPPFAAALAEVSSGVAQRVEAYLDGVEIANGYVELRDGGEQRRRWEAERSAEAAPMDEGLLADLEGGGLPACVGMALGVDRLHMALVGARSLAEVSPFFLDLL